MISESNSERVSKILSECKEVILVVEPRAKVFLFGSFARGQARRGSDIDLLVLLPKGASRAKKLAILDATYPVELAHGILITCFVETEAFWKKRLRQTPFGRTVEKERIAV